MSLKFCDICDQLREYNSQEDILSCGHAPDADPLYPVEYESLFDSYHIEEEYDNDGE